MLKCKQKLTRRDFLFASASYVSIIALAPLEAKMHQKQGYYPEEKVIQLDLKAR